MGGLVGAMGLRSLGSLAFLFFACWYISKVAMAAPDIVAVVVVPYH